MAEPFMTGPTWVLAGCDSVTTDAGLILSHVLSGGEPGRGKSFTADLFTVCAGLAEPDCLACPPDCRSCPRDWSTCACDEHAEVYPEFEPDQDGEVA